MPCVHYHGSLLQTSQNFKRNYFFLHFTFRWILCSAMLFCEFSSELCPFLTFCFCFLSFNFPFLGRKSTVCFLFQVCDKLKCYTSPISNMLGCKKWKLIVENTRFLVVIFHEFPKPFICWVSFNYFQFWLFRSKCSYYFFCGSHFYHCKLLETQRTCSRSCRCKFRS